jgi:protein-disulfide isomerase
MKPLLRFLAISALITLSVAACAADTSVLKPPAGARVAIVVFEDLECPTCARVYPQVWEAANANKVAVVLHDFPIPSHAWSFEAAVFARFFDTKSEKLGNDFRGYIYSNQPQITKSNLHQYAEKFGNDNKTPVPFAVDPEGKLKEKVIADRTLGNQLGITGTPTIYVVGNGGAATPAIKVTDFDKLSQAVQEMLQKVPAEKAPAKTGTTKSRKTVKKTQ